MSKDASVPPRRLPLTVAQRGMWVGCKIAPPDVVFNLAEAVEIHGAVDEACFVASLHQLSQEAECVRARVLETPTGPELLLLPVWEHEFQVLDFSDAPNPWAKALQHMQTELSAPLEVQRDELWHCALLRLAPTHYVWYHRAHHLLMDGYSASLLTNRMAEIYGAKVRGEVPPPHDFGSLAELHQDEARYRESDRYQRDRQFWLQQLAGLPEPVSLSQRPHEGTRGLLRATERLPDSTRQRLKAVAQAADCTLPQVLIALVAAYCFRCTDAPDLVLGSPVTARTGRQSRRIPGMVANAVALRFSLSVQMTLEDLTRQVGTVLKRALKHQQFRLEELRRELGLLTQGRALSRLSANIEPFDYDLRFGDHPTTTHNLSNGSVDDLTVFIYDRDDGRGLRIDFDANPSLYTPDELHVHLQRFMRMVNLLADAPLLPIGELALLDEQTEQTVLEQSTGPQRRNVADHLPQWVEREAEAHPQRPAVCSEDGERRYTLSEVNELANGWAHALIADGLGPGDRVAVALPRDEQLPIALLAVMKAGAAYVPIDPDLPQDRLALMLEDARPALLITTLALDAQLPQLPLRRLYLAGPRPGHANPTDADRIRPLRPHDAAYVIFTSGSTGRPKGVQVRQRNLVNFLAAMREELSLSSTDHWLAITTVSFDIAALELFGPLVNGACVTVASRATVREPRRLADCLLRQGITVLQATPSLWQGLLQVAPTAVTGLRALVGGEALPTALARELCQRGAQLTNLYGPTETTVWSTLQAVSADPEGPPTIGRPIWNTQTYVLDGALQPVGPGAWGELFIAGDGVAAGYLGRRGLTAERFLPNPFGPPGSRMYRSGDIVRWTEQRTLAYLGRADHQVKIRGVRIELGDVESAITRCAGVQRAVVVAETSSGATRLIAYCVAKPGDTLEPTELRRLASALLSDAMMPSVFMVLDSLPLTPNGKVDRRALPVPERAMAATSQAPRNLLEQQLAELWCRLLRQPSVGIHDSFFDLGGDSMLAVELLVGIEQLVGSPVSLATLFEAVTIAQLAERLQGAQASDPLATLLPLRQQGDAAPLFCVHPVLGVGWAFSALLRHLPPDRPVYALQSPGLQPGCRLPDTLEALASSFIQELRQVQPSGPYHLVGWSFGGLVAHEMAVQLEDQGEQVELLALLDSFPFAPPRGGEAQDEAALARAALAFLGLSTADSEQAPQSWAALAAHLCEVYQVRSMPMVSNLQRQRADLVEVVVEVISQHLHLARAHQPRRCAADVLFIEAAKRHVDAAGLSDLVLQNPQLWQDHGAGRLEVCAVAADHQGMLDGEAAAEVGALLSQRLTAQRKEPATAKRTEQHTEETRCV